MGELILIVLVVAGILLLMAICSGIAILFGLVIAAVAPSINRLMLSIIATGVLPMGVLVLLLVAPMVAIDGEFRGPEVLGFAILLATAIFFVVILWPASLYVTYRFFRNR